MTTSCRLVLAVCLSFLTLLGGPAAADEKEPKAAAFLPHTPKAWLGIAPVDHRSRRPINPDQIFSRHMVDPESAPPREGAEVTGEREAPQTWQAIQADDQGQVKGKIAWAYTKVDAPRGMIAMAWLKSGGTLFINGTPYVGAIYGDRFEVPVRLEKGTNHVYVRGVRGAFTLTFSKPPARVFLAPFRRTTPDVVAGEGLDTVAAVLLVNAQDSLLESFRCKIDGNEWLQGTPSPTSMQVAPLSMVQVHLPLKTKPGKVAPKETGNVEIGVTIEGVGTALVPLQIRKRDKAVVRTFVSKIDDSVQRYGMREPLSGAGKQPTMGLVLSLHGAGVNPRGQANAYGRKKDFWLFAATNRDRFGFDWQDWGRLDAYEVLEEGLRISGVPRERVYLTGHSMGGHGTWHLGANDPDGFAAIAPSAGWISFDTYPGPRRKGELTSIWHAADGASLTRKLIGNLKQLPTFIVHGMKDDNVPWAQAQEMEALLTKAGAPPKTHYEKDKKHWWDGYPEPGAQCVDWPGIFKLFRKHTIAKAPTKISFSTVDPSVDSQHHWISVQQVLRYGERAFVDATWDPKTGKLDITTNNVGILYLDLPGPCKRLSIDASSQTFDEPITGKRRWQRRGETWSELRRAYAGKTPTAGGPFKRAFTNRFVMVYGTTGEEDEQKALLEQARFDAQRWMYRGNGQAILLSDTAFLDNDGRLGLATRNTIVYGNRDTNAAYKMLARGTPVVRGAVHHGALRRGEDIGACYVGPGPRPGTLVGFCASTGVTGARLGFSLMKFISGAGWPDFVFFNEDILDDGDGGVFEAGWYDSRWVIQKGSFLREE